MAATPFAASILLYLFSSSVGRRLPPATAAAVLTALAVAVATATGLVLAAAGVLTLAQAPRIAADGHWSAHTLQVSEHLPLGVGALAGVIVVGLLAATLLKAGQAIHDLARATIACRRLAPATTDLVILDDDAGPCAYTIGGLRGRVVVSTAMLRALSADERRVLLAHEAAHLRHRHHLYLHLVALAAAGNPLLHPLARAVNLAVERWADEEAANHVGDRQLAARGLARAGLARAAASPQHQMLPAADTYVADRVRSLLAPPTARRPLIAAALVAVAGTCFIAAAATVMQTRAQIEAAETVYLNALEHRPVGRPVASGAASHTYAQCVRPQPTVHSPYASVCRIDASRGR
jgi:Zn-dependent protease with chaperone function